MRVSIIVPVFNAAEHIHKCLDSICLQLDDGCELLLLDDGSTDESLEILRQYQKKRPEQIKVFSHPNHGAAYTRNRGIEEASGDYIGFIDQDDYIDPDYLEQYLRAAESSNADILLGGYRRISDDRILFRVDATDDPWYPYTVTAPWARLYRREYLRAWARQVRFLEYPMGEDVFFNLACYQGGAQITCVDYSGYNWYFNEKSVSNTEQRGFNDKIEFVKLLDALYGVCDPESVFARYFLVRYSIWYLLFSGRAATKEAFMREYRNILDWMRMHGIPLVFPSLSRKMRSERWSVRISSAMFLALHRTHTVSLFAGVYCKGK